MGNSTETFRCDVTDGLRILDSMEINFSGTHVKLDSTTDKTYLYVSLDPFSASETGIYINLKDTVTGLATVTKAAIGKSLATQASIFNENGGVLGDPNIRVLAAICVRKVGP